MNKRNESWLQEELDRAERKAADEFARSDVEQAELEKSLQEEWDKAQAEIEDELGRMLSEAEEAELNKLLSEPSEDSTEGL